MVAHSWMLPWATGSAPRAPPALLTTASTGPSASTSRARRSTSSASCRSAATQVQPVWAARSRRRWSRRAVATTCQPWEHRSRTVAAPIPVEAPVTTARRAAGSRDAGESGTAAAEAVEGRAVETAAERAEASFMPRSSHPCPTDPLRADRACPATPGPGGRIGSMRPGGRPATRYERIGGDQRAGTSSSMSQSPWIRLGTLSPAPPRSMPNRSLGSAGSASRSIPVWKRSPPGASRQRSR